MATYERKDGDNRTEQRAPDLRQQRVTGEEEIPPKAIRHPRTQRASHQQSADNITQHRQPFHNEDV
jgi:hypothetical protein